ncbi:MAG: tetratricopeptide repeat protein [Sphingobium sp.]
MAETPPINEALLREVDDAVRQDQLRSFWERYGRWILVLVVAGLAAFGGWLYWSHHSKEESGKLAEKAQEAINAVSNGEKPSDEVLNALGTAGQPGYRAIAMLTRAGIAAQNGDYNSAATLYERIAADEKLPGPYRDLATIRQVALEFDTLKPQEVVDRLKPLAVEGGPWFGSAGEMTAIAYMKMGKKELAGPIFAAIAKDEKAPTTLRSRARQMAGLLGVDAVETEEDQDGKDGAGNATAKE